MKNFLFILLYFLSFSAYCQNDLIHDTQIHEVIHKAIGHTYNFEFAEAEVSIAEVKKKYGEHPVYEFLKAANLYWEMAYKDCYKEKSADYLQLLQTSLVKAQNMLAKNPKDVEAIFFTMANQSSLALFYAERDDHIKAVNYMKKAYTAIKEGFTLKDSYVEFYFSSGLYDYYVEQYPETHPVFKPFMIFFSNGDKARGLKELDYISKNGIFTKTEALHYLTNIYLKYESKPDKAVIYSQQLVSRYPENIYFITRHIEGLLNTGQYKDAEKYAYKLYKTGKKPFVFRSYVFYGTLYEQYHKDYETARKYYQQAISLSKEIQGPGQDYLSFAYAGLARLAHLQGNTEKAVEYYEKTLDIAEYTSVIKEAKAYLDQYD